MIQFLLMLAQEATHGHVDPSMVCEMCRSWFDRRRGAVK